MTIARTHRVLAIQPRSRGVSKVHSRTRTRSPSSNASSSVRTRKRSASASITEVISARVSHPSRPSSVAASQRTSAESGSPGTIEYVVFVQ